MKKKEKEERENKRKSWKKFDDLEKNLWNSAIIVPKLRAHGSHLSRN